VQIVRLDSFREPVLNRLGGGSAKLYGVEWEQDVDTVTNELWVNEAGRLEIERVAQKTPGTAEAEGGIGSEQRRRRDVPGGDIEVSAIVATTAAAL